MGPVVQTSSGRVRGTEADGVVGFRGIPYAASPVRDLRFAPPAPPERWDGVRDAGSFGPVAHQLTLPGPLTELLTPDDPPGDDCLNLNVWTPDPSAKLPVMVWIHGGGFYSGSSRETIYRGETFARDGVVCVTINYRLGPLGFLYVGGEGAGNYGLLDQIAALRWVQDNIAGFGGDPSQVTVAGQSAGGWSVGTLLATPAARGLFQRAIVMSGGAHHSCPVGYAEHIAGRFCAGLGIPPDDLDGLRALPAQEVMDRMLFTFGDVAIAGDVDRFGIDITSSGIPFLPVVGTDLVPERAIDAVVAGSAAGVDLLVGHTSEEFRLFLLASDPTNGFVARFGYEEWVADCFELAFPGRGNEVRTMYARNRPGARYFDLLNALGGDQQFRIPSVCLADSQAKHANTYAYQFSWPGAGFDGLLGATHCMDLGFVWDALDDEMSLKLTGPNPPQELADRMHASWVAFVADGTPAHSNIPDWPKYDASRPVMNFGDTVALLSDPNGEETALWEGDPLRHCNPRGAGLAGWS